MEHYDTAGKFNVLDNGSPIDSSGALLVSFLSVNAGTGGGPGATELTFTGVNDLGEKLAEQCGVSLCVTQRLLAYAELSAKLPPPGATDSQLIAEIASAASSGNLRDLLHAIVESDTFLRAQ